MEESVLSLGSCHPLLNIIHYQDIDCLIEINEVVGRIMQYGIGVLYLEQACRNVQDTFLWI